MPRMKHKAHKGDKGHEALFVRFLLSCLGECLFHGQSYLFAGQSYDNAEKGWRRAGNRLYL